MSFQERNAELSKIYIDNKFIVERFTNQSGLLWVWGTGDSGALGNNAVANQSSPLQTVAGGTNWKQVSCGTSYTGAVKTDGTLWVWGVNTNGRLGNNSVLHQSSPVQTVAGGTNWKQVACSIYHTAAIKTDGTLWLWGSGTGGRLGTNDQLHQSSPVQTIAGGTNWKQVSCGQNHTAAIKTDGTLWTWGYNGFGQLGTNNIVLKSSPVQTIAGGTNWKQVSCSSSNIAHHTAAIKTDGTLWMWGSGTDGQLGTNNRIHISSPVQTIAGGTNWKQVSCTSGTTAAVKTDGTLWVWGANTTGNLGTDDIIHRSSPVQTVAGGTNWKQVSCGEYSTAAIKTDGTLWTWGLNINGRLGTNNVIDRSSPVQTVAGGTNWKQVACWSHHSAAIESF